MKRTLISTIILSALAPLMSAGGTYAGYSHPSLTSQPREQPDPKFGSVIAQSVMSSLDRRSEGCVGWLAGIYLIFLRTTISTTQNRQGGNNREDNSALKRVEANGGAERRAVLSIN